MIDFDNPPVMASDYRGTIEVYLSVPYEQADGTFTEAEWYWRCKSRNGQILASGEGYKRRAGALNAIDTQYGVRLTGQGIDIVRVPPRREEHWLVVPWRVVIHDRNGDTTIGALY